MWIPGVSLLSMKHIIMQVPPDIIGHKLKKWSVSENQNWAWMWSILQQLLVKKKKRKTNKSVGSGTSCEWQHNGGWCVKECSFAVRLQHWLWPLRPKRLSVCVCVCVCVFVADEITFGLAQNFTSLTYYGGDCVEYLWRILDILPEIICSFRRFSHRVVLRQVNGLFQSEFSTEWDLVLLFFFEFRYPLVYSRSSNSFLRLLTCLLFPSIFTSLPFRGMLFLPKMWSIQLAFLRYIVH